MGYVSESASKIKTPLYWDNFAASKLSYCFAWIGYGFWGQSHRYAVFLE